MQSTELISSRFPAHLRGEGPPQLQVVVDTEEEFDWAAEPCRSQTSVSCMDSVGVFQDVCEQYGLSPCYVVDYPIATQERGAAELRQRFRDGKCEIGAHLHPWVNPPSTEALSRSNMYPGNLPRELEFEKIQALKNAITDAFGTPPKAYKAGRYGFGPQTAKTLHQLGFCIDLSFSPAFDHGSDGGPDYSGDFAQPFWFGDDRDMLEIPLSSSFVGVFGKSSSTLFGFAEHLREAKVPAVLSRLKLLERLALSPEGYDFDEHVRLTRYLLSKGVRTFTWSYHSSSFAPGLGPYVKTDADLQVFLQRFERYFDYFFNELDGAPTTPSKLYDALEAVE